MTTTIWHNGTFKIDSTPIITANDRLRFGEGVFRTILAVDGKLQFAQNHLSALQKAASLFWPSYALPPHEKLIKTAHDLLLQNGCTKGQAMVNIFITGGVSQQGLAAQPNPEAEIFMRAAAWKTPVTPTHAVIVNGIRRNEHSPLSNIKYCGGYADQILALREANEKGGNEAIFLNTAGHICCASVATLVMIKGTEFITPPLTDGPQEGTTRARFITRYKAVERSITRKELRACDGIYLLNSVRGAIPVKTLDGVDLPAPKITIDKDFHLE